MNALLPESLPKPLLDAVRHFNRRLVNPLILRFAGHRRAYAAVITHAGRRSGKQYTTPVVLERFEGGFVIPLAYGTRVDWLLNILAAERATISWRGDTYDVVKPEVVDADTALRLMPSHRQSTFARFGLNHYLKVTDAQADSSP